MVFLESCFFFSFSLCGGFSVPEFKERSFYLNDQKHKYHICMKSDKIFILFLLFVSVVIV